MKIQKKNIYILFFWGGGLGGLGGVGLEGGQGGCE